MFGFMTAVLGSLVFWAIYLVVSFFAAIFTIKATMGSSFIDDLVDEVDDAKRPFCVFCYVFMFLMFMAAWWGVILVIVGWKVSSVFLMWIARMLTKVLSSADSMVPDVEVEDGKITIKTRRRQCQ